MGQTQIHRGPDGEGYFVDPCIALGMRRLSIIDLDNGNQPFFSEDKKIVVVCNGEIYNHLQLRQDLESKGYKFKTRCDIEVIPFLYQEYGISLAEKLNGMYAIAIYDVGKNETYLVRDRLGIKPLYYSIIDDDLIFSSELKSILATEKCSKEIDYSAISTYLELSYIPVPMSPFKDIRKLESGAYLKFSKKKHIITKYWKPELSKKIEMDKDVCLKQIKDLIEDSMELQLKCDVPLGCFLSGGTDSSAVTAFASKISEEQVNTFHMHWDNAKEKMDESSSAELVSKKFKTVHYVDRITEDILVKQLSKLVFHLEEPFADAAFIPTFALAEFAAKKIKVILSGAGGDELFGGYFHHKEFSTFKSALTKMLYDSAPAFSFFDRWNPKYSKNWKSYFPWFKKAEVKESFDRIYKNNRDIDDLNAILLCDILTYLQDDILFLTDKMTMAASIECRVPLLDHRLVELSLKIPSEFKFENGNKKVIFKELLKNLIPSEILNRKKEGFGAPIQTWLNKYRKKHFDCVLIDGYLMKNGIVDKDHLMKLINKESLTSDDSWMYWKILILEVWFKTFIDN